MKRIIYWVLLVFSLVYMDSQGYYYGIGEGFFNKENIPNRFYLSYGYHSSLEPDISVFDKDMNLYILSSSYPLDKDTDLEKILGYWYNESTMIFKVKDFIGEIRYFELYEKATNKLNKPYFLEEQNSLTDDDSFNLVKRDFLSRYIDLDKSITYFTVFRAILYLLYIIFVISLVFETINFIKNYFSNLRKNTNC